MPKILMILGGLTFVLGLLLWLFPSLPHLGHLPGDLVIRGDRTTFYFPLATSILVSILLSALFYLLR